MNNKRQIHSITKGILITALIVAVAAISLIMMNQKKELVLHDREKETLKDHQPAEVLPQRNYTDYTAVIEFSSDLHRFLGSETINYVHEYSTATNTIVLDLDLNEYGERKAHYDYLPQKKPEVFKRGCEYGELTINKTEINGKEAVFNQYGSELVIHLDEDLDTNESIDISLEFEGTVPFINYYIGGNQRNIWMKSFLPQLKVYNDVEGWVDARKFGDENFLYAETSQYNVTVIVDKAFDVITGVNFTNCQEDGDKKKYTFELDMVRDFGLYIGLPKNKEEFLIQNNKKLTIYTDKKVDLEDVKGRIDEAFEYYNNIFGTYPYDNFTVIDCATDYDISFPMMLITDLNYRELFMERAGKNIGKQWIPYIIMHNPKDSDWLNCGLEEYLAAREKSSIQTLKRQLENSAIDKKKSNNNLNINYVYYGNYYEDMFLKPTKTLLSMEERIGEDNFKQSLRQYYKSYAFKMPEKNDFIVAILNNGTSNTNEIFYGYPYNP